MNEIKPGQRLQNADLRAQPGQSSLELALQLTKAVPTADGLQVKDLGALVAALDRIQELEQGPQSTLNVSIAAGSNAEHNDGFEVELDDLADSFKKSGVEMSVRYQNSQWEISFSAPDQASLEQANTKLAKASVSYNLGAPVIA